jgi:preprotein translocase subunit SecE
VAKDQNIKVESKSIETKAKALKGSASKGKDQKSTERRQPNFIQRYFKETIGELRKVTWPTRREATNLTLIVVAVVAIMSVFLGLILDNIFSKLLSLLFA